MKLLRLLLNAKPGENVDHINRVTLDNRLCNLRICTNAQNAANTKSCGDSSKFKGVSWNKMRRWWLVAFRANGKYVFVGWFKDENEAAKAYNARAYELLGDFAILNPVH